jgi:phospholipid/cholesterol/gamma-HCH transport system substrate-binding protein
MEVVETTIRSGSSRIRVAAGLLFTLIAAALLGLGGMWAARRLGLGVGYELTADFASVGGLQAGATVEIAGVAVGTVESISLRHDAAHVMLRLDASVWVPTDSTAAIETEGLIGETHMAIQPGREGTHLAPGSRIGRTVSAVDLEDLIAARIFGKVP